VISDVVRVPTARLPVPPLFANLLRVALTPARRWRRAAGPYARGRGRLPRGGGGAGEV